MTREEIIIYSAIAVIMFLIAVIAIISETYKEQIEVIERGYKRTSDQITTKYWAYVLVVYSNYGTVSKIEVMKTQVKYNEINNDPEVFKTLRDALDYASKKYPEAEYCYKEGLSYEL